MADVAKTEGDPRFSGIEQELLRRLDEDIAKMTTKERLFLEHLSNMSRRERRARGFKKPLAQYFAEISHIARLRHAASQVNPNLEDSES